MDISKLVQKEVISVVIYDTDNFNPTDITIDIHNVNSDGYRNAAVQSRKKGYDSCEFLAAMTVGFKNVFIGEEEVEFSFENALKIYRSCETVKNQVEFAINRRQAVLMSA